MKYLGTIQDPKDLTTREYVDDADTALSTRINTNEDNIAMAESDIESLQTDTGALKTDMSAVKGALATLQDTYVPNTRKINNKALDADITLTASDVGALESTYKPTFVVNVRTISTGLSADKTFEEITNAYNNGYDVYCMFANLYLIHLKLITSNGIQFSSSIFSGNHLQNKVSWYTLTVSSSNKWHYQSDDNVIIPTATSQLTNDSGFLTSAPVTSVNNKTGAVTLTASDVGAIAKVSSATEGNLPVLTTNGELTDSGKNISDIGIIAVFDSTTYEEIREAYESSTPVICFYNANLTAGGKVEYRLHALTDETAIFVGMESVYPDLTVDFLLCSSSSEWTVDYAYLLPAAATEHKGDILMVNDVGGWQITAPPFLNAKVVTNISCPLSAWVSDTTTYTDYQFKANLTVAGATADYIPLVNFAPSEQESGNYIGATSGNGIVTIWCKNKPSGAITIPNIILTKEN